MAGIVSFGAYIPVYRLERKLIGQAWQMPGMPGERSVANADEDSITMAVEAGLDCISGIEPSDVGGLFFATTTAPYAEKQCAAVIADALDLGSEILTADYTDSLRCATSALRAACDAVDSGSADSVLVVAADCRMAEPEDMMEQTLGDAAAAILVGKENVIAEINGAASIADDYTGPWRTARDKYVRVFEVKLDTGFGYMKNLAKAVTKLSENCGIQPEDADIAVLPSPDPRSNVKLAKSLGISKDKLQDSMFMTVGQTGSAQALLMLAATLEGASAGQKILLGNFGDGADAFYLMTTEAVASLSPKRGVAAHIENKRMLPGYNQYLQFRKVIDRNRFTPNSSAVIYWRDRDRVVKLYGARCGNCGSVQYPIPTVCAICRERAEFERIPLARNGKIHTFILDHLSGGKYLVNPIPRCSISLDDGSRVFLEMTDCDPREVKVEMPVELTFRLLHEGAGFENYYWKCRPPRMGGE